VPQSSLILLTSDRILHVQGKISEDELTQIVEEVATYRWLWHGKLLPASMIQELWQRASAANTCVPWMHCHITGRGPFSQHYGKTITSSSFTMNLVHRLGKPHNKGRLSGHQSTHSKSWCPCASSFLTASMTQTFDLWALLFSIADIGRGPAARSVTTKCSICRRERYCWYTGWQMVEYRE